jgi:hypothetical protein
MGYADLNPIRAGIANSPETSDFTTFQERIVHYHKTRQQADNPTEVQTSAPKGLLPFAGNEHQGHQACLNFSLLNYLELTDWVWYAIREDKAGTIPAHLTPMLGRLNINYEVWLVQ